MTDLHKYLEGLKGYARWFGGAHEKECPTDDTCECRGKPFNAAIDGIINELSEPTKGTWVPGAIKWFQADGCWMGKQSIAVVGKVWPAKDTTKGAFYWQAAAWASEHENGKRAEGYSPSLEDAKKKVEEICREIPTLTMDQEIEQTGIAADALRGEAGRLARPLVFCQVEAHEAEAVFCLACSSVLQTEDAPRVTRAKHNAARHQSDQCIYIALRETRSDT